MATAVANDRLLKRFQKWDSDGNGILEWQDFEQEAGKIAQNFGKRTDSPEAQALREAFRSLFDHLTQAAGAPSNGPLTQDQFLSVTGDLIFQGGEADFNRALGPVVKGIIGLCDKNADGQINAGEFEAWLGGIGVDRSKAQEAFRKVDTDDDGELSLDELLAAVRKYHFGQLDVELLG
ncbi:EF-hand domain-containing protein [Streptomyces violens]|uniref:EF-hand domain-containing protein n=1 Tax=Streptomyces violens TaxID=66377 RepID=UPI0004BE65CC|nr:EF-hand domain-containing protein [Streptomyces violens]